MVTQVPSARVRCTDDALLLVNGHGQFQPDWCADRGRCCRSADHGSRRVPCPGHGRWLKAQPIPLTVFVAAVCAGTVRQYQWYTRILWMTRAYWIEAEKQRVAAEAYDRWRTTPNPNRLKFLSRLRAVRRRDAELDERLEIARRRLGFK